MEEEEGDGITPTVGSSPPPAVSETLSAGSVEDPGFHNAAEAPPPDDSSSESVVVLTDDLKEKIIRQVEYYFSDENLPTDKFLLKHVKKDKDGFVPVAVVASFRKMKKLVPNKSLIVTALRESLQLVLSSDGKRVRRINPLPVTEIKDTKACTVIVENLPQDCSTENLQKIFGDVGNVKSISIRDPQTLEGSTKSSKAERPISGKIHALVEYETAKEAEKAVAALKNVQSWRNDMRVELLLKWTDKYGVVAKIGRKGGGSEKNDNHPANHVAGNVPVNHTASNNQNVKYIDTHETPEQEEGKHLANDKAGRSRRNRGRGRGQSGSQNQHNPNGHGHGSPPTSSRSEFVRKPPPGPRMPDGTKGFTMGRGRPPLSNHSPEE